MRYSREREEMIAAMADEWAENFKVAMSESQSEQLMRETIRQGLQLRSIKLDCPTSSK